MCSVPTRWIPTCSPKASRPMTGSTWATESSARWRARRCRRGRSRKGHLRGRGDHMDPPDRDTLHRRCRREHLHLWRHLPHPEHLLPRELEFPRRPPARKIPHRRRHPILLRLQAARRRKRLQVRSPPTVPREAHRSPSPSTTHAPVSISVRTAKPIGRQTWLRQRRPRRGRTCWPSSPDYRAGVPPVTRS